MKQENCITNLFVHSSATDIATLAKAIFAVCYIDKKCSHTVGNKYLTDQNDCFVQPFDSNDVKIAL